MPRPACIHSTPPAGSVPLMLQRIDAALDVAGIVEGTQLEAPPYPTHDDTDCGSGEMGSSGEALISGSVKLTAPSMT
jgi:hypothetical protein